MQPALTGSLRHILTTDELGHTKQRPFTEHVICALEVWVVDVLPDRSGEPFAARAAPAAAPIRSITAEAAKDLSIGYAETSRGVTRGRDGTRGERWAAAKSSRARPASHATSLAPSKPLRTQAASHRDSIGVVRDGKLRVDPTKVLDFKDEQSFYEWLGEHWDTEEEVWIKIHKVRSGLVSITPTEAIDVVLCWGWIDGIRKGLDEKSFLQRYTPRRKKSVWSAINVANVARLTKAGRMQPPGLAQVAAAKADGRWEKAYSMANTKAPDDLLAAIRAVPTALAMYEALSSQNRFALIFRTLSMKTAAGRKKKIAGFVAMLKKGKTIYPNGKGSARRSGSSA